LNIEYILGSRGGIEKDGEYGERDEQDATGICFACDGLAITLRRMIRSSDIDKLLDCPQRRRESVKEWCRRNEVDETALHRLVEIYGAFPSLIEAFRLGYELNGENEPKGESAGSEKGERRYAVKFVVVDTADGRIIGNATTNRDWAQDQAATYNDVEADSAGARH
jgi:hypothetical protein